MTHQSRVSLGLFTLFVCSFSLLVFSCATENEEQYPQFYQYHEVEAGPTKIYVLTANSQNEIATFSSGITDDSFLMAGLQTVRDLFPIEQIELLDASQVRITALDNMGSPNSVTVGYAREGDRISISEPGGSESILFDLDPDRTAARLALQCVQHTQKSSSGTIFFGPLDFSFATNAGAIELVNQYRTQLDLQAGDTVAVNFSNFLFKRQ